ncbi:MAG: glutathione S-transferase family protein [Pararhodobacter sp.]
MKQTQVFRLHCFPESGNSYKVALMLTLCGAHWDPVYVNFFGGETKTAAWRVAVNEMGEVPVLEKGEIRIAQSAVILGYLAEVLHRFDAHDPAERRELMRWLFFDNHKFTSYFVTHRFLRAFTRNPDAAVLSFLRSRIDSCFAIVENRLETNAFILGGLPTIADLSMVGYLYYPKTETGYDFPVSHPNIARWLERIAALPGWRPPYEMIPGNRFDPASMDHVERCL